MDAIREALYNTLAEDHPQTVRGVFYRLVGTGAIPKTEAAYQSIVVRLLSEMRRAGVIPFSWLADSTRWMHVPETHGSLRAMLEQSAEFYKRDLWQRQRVRVECWCEKAALSGVLYQETSVYGVPLMPCRGYPSLSFLFSAAEEIAASEKPTYIFFCGDWDPSGAHIPRKIEADLRRFAPDAEIHFERFAVWPHHIALYDLPSRPTKRSDTRSKSFTGASVELDALPSHVLRGMIRERIERHIDPYELEQTRLIEQQERESLNRIVAALPEVYQ
ncbi:MAG: hypothetical protein IPM24_26925 [Bryobacterales bacterium]|nr:hypothetical protein [Bryobacterales bacterium]